MRAYRGGGASVNFPSMRGRCPPLPVCLSDVGRVRGDRHQVHAARAARCVGKRSPLAALTPSRECLWTVHLMHASAGNARALEYILLMVRVVDTAWSIVLPFR